MAIVSEIRVPGKGDSAGYLFIGRPNPTYPVATLEEFAQWGPTTYVALVQAGVNPSFLSGPNQDLQTTVRNKIIQLNAAAQRISQIEVSTADLLASPFGGLVQRTTTFRGDQAGAFAGQQFFVEGPSLNGLTPEERVAFLKQLAKDDYDHNLNILYRDPATDEIVSISATPFSGDVVRV